MEHIFILALLALWNFIVFAMYGLDKRKAKKGKWRTSEFRLILSAFLMGGLGAFLAMGFFRHKTKHIKFKILVPLALILNLGALALYHVATTASPTL